MNTNFESDIPSPSCDSVKQKSLIGFLDKHALYLAIAGLVAGFGARANALVQDEPVVIESKALDTNSIPAQTKANSELQPVPPDILEGGSKPAEKSESKDSDTHNAPAEAEGIPELPPEFTRLSSSPAEATATSEQYVSAKNKFQAIKRSIYALDPNKKLYADTKIMWLNRKSTSALITEANVPKLRKGNRFYSLVLKHIVCNGHTHTNPAENCTNRHFKEFPLLSYGPFSSGPQSLTKITLEQIDPAGNTISKGYKIVLAFNGERIELQLFDREDPSIVNHQVIPNTKSYVRGQYNQPVVPPHPPFQPPVPFSYFSEDYTYLDTKLSEIKQILEAMLAKRKSQQESSNQRLKNRF